MVGIGDAPPVTRGVALEGPRPGPVCRRAGPLWRIALPPRPAASPETMWNDTWQRYEKSVAEACLVKNILSTVTEQCFVLVDKMETAEEHDLPWLEDRFRRLKANSDAYNDECEALYAEVQLRRNESMLSK